jgi:hypothetical protein
VLAVAKLPRRPARLDDGTLGEGVGQVLVGDLGLPVEAERPDLPGVDVGVVERERLRLADQDVGGPRGSSPSAAR